MTNNIHTIVIPLGVVRTSHGVKVGTLGRQNERNICYVRLTHTSIFGLCFMSVCLMKSNCYSFIYSSLSPVHR